jgi:hypothetical protein
MIKYKLKSQQQFRNIVVVNKRVQNTVKNTSLAAEVQVQLK